MFDIIKATFKTGSSAVASIFLRVISAKILSVILGPAGIGFYSLLRQVRDTLQPLASLSGGTAIVQGVASTDGEEQNQYIGTVATLLGINTVFFTIFLVLFAPSIARFIFGNDVNREIIILVRWVGIPLGLGIWASYLLSILNGYRAIGRLALVQVVGVVGLAVLSFPLATLVQRGHQAGLLLLITVIPLITVTSALYFLWRAGWLKRIRFRLNRRAARHFFWISIPTLIAGFGRNGMLLAVRSMINRFAGLSAAGFFDVGWAFSLMYVNLVTSSFGTYYLPTLSGLRNQEERLTLINRVIRFSTLLLVPLIVSLVVLKPWIVGVFYSPEFLPAIQLMRWMLIADYFKVTSWIFAMTVVAYADMKVFLWTELFFFGIFTGIVALSTEVFASLEGVGVAFLVMYIGYWGYMLYYAYRQHYFLPKLKLTFHWTGGYVIIITASIFTWSQNQVNWPLSIVWIIISMVYSTLMLEKEEYLKIKQIALNPRSLLS